MIRVDPLTQLEDRLTDFLCEKVAKLQSRSKGGRFDENKISEYVMRDLLNILYGTDLEVEAVSNSAGFDLCCFGRGLMVQVTSECTDGKILDCLKKTARRVQRQRELEGFRLLILFMTTDSQKTQTAQRQALRKLRQEDIDLSRMQFDFRTDIIDFNALINCLLDRDFSAEQMAQLQSFLDKQKGYMAVDPPEKDKVSEVIDQYVDNFNTPLFMHTGDKRFTLKNLYVEPEFTDPDGSYFSAQKIAVQLESFLWKQPKDGILLIEGDAAIGKTSLVSWMCHHYRDLESAVRGQLFRDRPLVCVRLRELEFQEDDLSACAVLRYLNIPDGTVFLRRYPDAIMILDGADELAMVNNCHPNSVEEFILNLRQELGLSKLIITTRPLFLKPENFHSRLFRTQRLILSHFDRSKRAQWLHKYKKQGAQVAQRTEAYILGLTGDDAAGVADTPLALYLLASCDVDDDLRDNAWALYHEIFSKAIVKAYYNNPRVWGAAGIMDAEKAGMNYRVVAQIAFRMFQNSGSNRYHITREELDEAAAAAGLEGITAEMVKQTCVLCAYWKNTHTGTLEFYHNNIRAFFLCEYICDHLNSAFDAFGKDSDWDALIREFCRIFCWGKISGTTWQQTFSFICLRLRAESQSRNRQTLYARLRQSKAIDELADKLMHMDSMWNYVYPSHPYMALKRVFSNSLMFLHLMVALVNQHDAEDSSRERTFLTQIPLNGASGLGLLREWHSLLLERPHIPPVGYVSLLADTYLYEPNWSMLTMRELDVSRSMLNRVDFTDGKLEGSYWENAYLDTVDFLGCQLQGASFMETRLIHNNFRKALIRASTFSDSTLTQCGFTEAVLETAQLSHSAFQKCEFRGSRFSDVQIQSIQFNACSFAHTKFSDATLTDVRFTDSAFYRTGFDRVRMLNCHMEGDKTRIESTSFAGVTTQGCTFRNVSPRDAAVLRSIGFTEIQEPTERMNPNDSESNPV